MVSTEFESIGKCGVIMFNPMQNGCVHVTTQKYAGAATSYFIMEEFKIMYGGDGVKDINDSVDIKTAATDACSRGQFVNRHGVQLANNDSHTDERIFETETKEIAEQIAGGVENMVRRHGEEEKYSRRSPIPIRSIYRGHCEVSKYNKVLGSQILSGLCGGVYRCPG